MFSGMRSTSALYLSYPYHQNQGIDEKPNPVFGDQHYEQFNGQLHSVVSHGYSTSGSYLLHQNQNYDFGVKQSPMTNNGPFFYTEFTRHPLQEAVLSPGYSTSGSYPLHQNQNYNFGVKQSPMTTNGPLSYTEFTCRPLQEALLSTRFSTTGSYQLHQNQNYNFGVKHGPMTNNGPFSYTEFTCHRPLQEAPPSPWYSISRSYQLHQNQNYDFGVKQSLMKNNGPFSYSEFTCRPLQEALTFPLLQPAATQAQEQQVPVKGNAEEEVLIVKVKRPNSPNSRPHLIWTPELHACFIHAAMQLGGLFKATPKTMLGIMNVKGLTTNHLKSYLQKMRKNHPNDISAEEIMGHGIQKKANSHAPQVTEGEASSSFRPQVESNIGKYGRLLGPLYETLNYQQNLEIDSEEDLANFFNFEDCDLSEIASEEDLASNLNFEDCDLF